MTTTHRSHDYWHRNHITITKRSHDLPHRVEVKHGGLRLGQLNSSNPHSPYVTLVVVSTLPLHRCYLRRHPVWRPDERLSLQLQSQWELGRNAKVSCGMTHTRNFISTYILQRKSENIWTFRNGFDLTTLSWLLPSCTDSNNERWSKLVVMCSCMLWFTTADSTVSDSMWHQVPRALIRASRRQITYRHPGDEASAHN